MKTYRDQMHGLQFTPEQKAAMVDALLAASQAPHQRRPQPHGCGEHFFPFLRT